MVSLEKVDDAIIYELQIQREATERPNLCLISHDISTERNAGSRVSHHPAWINRRREDLSSTLILSILSDSPSSPAEMISCVIKLLAPEFFLQRQ